MGQSEPEIKSILHVYLSIHDVKMHNEKDKPGKILDQNFNLIGSRPRGS